MPRQGYIYQQEHGGQYMSCYGARSTSVWVSCLFDLPVPLISLVGGLAMENRITSTWLFANKLTVRATNSDIHTIVYPHRQKNYELFNNRSNSSLLQTTHNTEMCTHLTVEYDLCGELHALSPAVRKLMSRGTLANNYASLL